MDRINDFNIKSNSLRSENNSNSWSHVKFSRLQKNLQQTLFSIAGTLKIVRTLFQRSNR